MRLAQQRVLEAGAGVGLELVVGHPHRAGRGEVEQQRAGEARLVIPAAELDAALLVVECEEEELLREDQVHTAWLPAPALSSRSMRRWIAVWTLLGSLALAGSAQAGTYDVVSCGAPGAGGVNRAWTNEIVGDRRQLQRLRLRLGAARRHARAPAGRRPLFNGVNWTFTAPAGTQVSKLVTWRYLQALLLQRLERRRLRRPGPVLGGLGGEACVPPRVLRSVPRRVRAGVNASSRAEYANVNSNKVFYSTGCGQASCPTDNDSGQRYAEFHLYGTVVTVNDTTAPAVKLSGPLTVGGWQRPGGPQQLTYAATDGSGIRRLTLTGASTQGGDRACDYTRAAPCTNASGRFNTQLGDGVHPLTVTATDAGGNATPVTQTVRIDGTPPGARVAVARGKRIVVDVGDNVSGVASGHIAVRRTTRQPFRALKTKLRKGRLTARMDRGSAARSDIRITLTDVAGNRFQGLGTKLRITRARSGKVTVPFGRAVRLRGPAQPRARQVGPRRQGERDLDGLAQRVAAGVAARPRRRAAAGASRCACPRVPAACCGSPRRPPTARPAGPRRGCACWCRPRARSAPTGPACPAPGACASPGRVRTLGQPLPTRGLVIALQGFDRGRWRTFDDLRTDRRGRWSGSNQFSGRPGTYPIRVRIRRQSRFPFALGYSRAVRVSVR